MKELIELGFIADDDDAIFTRGNLKVCETKELDGYEYVIAWDIWQDHTHFGTYTDIPKMVKLLKQSIK